MTGLQPLHPAWKVTGRWPPDDATRAALVGRRLAERLNLYAGKSLTLTAGTPGNSSSSQPSTAEFTVSGILESGGPEEDQILGAARFRAAVGWSQRQSPSYWRSAP